MVSTRGGELVLRTTIACGVLVTVAVVLRLVAQWRNNRRFYRDDWWIVATLVPSYAMLTVGMLMVTIGGGGRHINTLHEADLILFLKTINGSLITYAVTITMVKISILLLYRRVFDVRKCRIATTILLCVCIGWGIAAVLALIFQCHPISGMWNPADTFTSKCFDIKAYYVGIAASNMSLDIIILALPIYMVWGYNGTGLRLPIGQKLMLTLVFLLGGLVCVASLLRVITIHLIKGEDLTYTVIVPYIWSQIEPTTAIICACLTTYRPLFRGLSFRPISNLSWFSSYQTRSTSNIGSRDTSSTDPSWPMPPKTDHRFAVDKPQNYAFHVPRDPSSESRMEGPSVTNEPPLGIYDQMMNRRTLADGIYEEMLKKRAAAEKDSGHGSEKGSVAGSWLESQSSDDGVDRGDEEFRARLKTGSGAW